LQRQRGHALLVHGAAGVGAFPFAMALAQSWLCEAHEAGEAGLACGRCGSCQLLRAKAHPDFLFVVPEELQRQLDWHYAGDTHDTDKAVKPSRQVLISQVRYAVEWVQRTRSRGVGKVVLIHPAETMNAFSANALLKTLEEPPPGTRLILTTPDPMRLLPTVRSRCQQWRLAEPGAAEATAWLATRAVAEPAVLLAACAGRPLDALALHEAGITASKWRQLPQALARGQASAVQGFALPAVLDLLMKLCHDAMAVAASAPPRYFEAGSVPAGASMARLRAWSLELQRVARHAAHPWNEAVLTDALVADAARALRSTAGAAARAGRPAPTEARAGFDTLPS
jgi:DNA polymerase III subunit delta'